MGIRSPIGFMPLHVDNVHYHAKVILSKNVVETCEKTIIIYRVSLGTYNLFPSSSTQDVSPFDSRMLNGTGYETRQRAMSYRRRHHTTYQEEAVLKSHSRMPEGISYRVEFHN